VTKPVKIFLFGLSTLVLFIAGFVVADVIWQMNYHRYASPNTGYYHGYVTADLTDVHSGAYWLRFKGESEPQWYWLCPTNFTYSHLDLEMYSDGEKTMATVELPSLHFRSGDVEGKLSAELLATFLLKDSQGLTNGMAQMDTIVGFITAAGEGKLPGPKHHGHRIEEPVNVRMYHWLLGRGIRGTVYAWLAIWITLVVFGYRQVFKKPSADRTPTASTSL